MSSYLSRPSVSVLIEVEGSGQSGTATLMSVGVNQTKVVVEIGNAPGVPQPAHIHPGTCDALDPKPAYSLTNVERGRSTTLLDASLQDLTEGEFAINVHKSASDIKTYAACGPLER